MRKILTYSSYIIASLVVILAFVTATTYTQLAIAIFSYPVLIYFAFKAFPHKPGQHPQKKLITAIKPLMKSAEEVQEKEETKTDIWNIADIDKRAFLKLVGGVGISLFLFSLLNKRAEGVFFGKALGGGTTALTDAAGNKINPAQQQPTDGYRISEMDNSAITYYGFINKDGAWFVMKEDTSTGSFRYARGDAGFPGNWSNREHLTYDYFNNIF